MFLPACRHVQVDAFYPLVGELLRAPIAGIYTGGDSGASSSRSSAAIQSFFITWANSNIRAATFSIENNQRDRDLVRIAKLLG